MCIRDRSYTFKNGPVFFGPPCIIIFNLVINYWHFVLFCGRHGSCLINKVNLHWFQLVPWWMTLSGFSYRYGTFILVCNQSPRPTQPGLPFGGKRNEYQPKGDDALRLGVKADMVWVWLAGKTPWSPCYTWTIPEWFRDSHYKVLHKLNFFYFTSVCAQRRSRPTVYTCCSARQCCEADA